MINYAISAPYFHYNINIALLDLMKKHPEYFLPKVKVDVCYGVFPWCVFDGGRIFQQKDQVSIEQVVEITQKYNSYNVPIRLVYTNPVLTPKDYTNRFGNLVLEVCENDMNQIVVADDNFAAYIREKYPKYSFVSSTTKCLNAEEFKKEISNDNYIEVCLDYNLNKNKQLLESLNRDERAKCEFLTNAICPPACPSRKEHYKLNGMFNLSYGRKYAVPQCGISGGILNPKTQAYHNNLSLEEIETYYEPNGFFHFKLEGRTLSEIDTAGAYVDYMVKPEYRTFVYSLLIHSIQN